MARFVSCMFGVGLIILCAGAVYGQSFPNRTIRLIGPEAGGGGDLAGRIIAQGLSTSLGQQVIVDNRGGNATMPVQALMQSPPDGYTLLIYSSTIWLLPFMQDNVPYDPVRDFEPVSLAVSSPNILVTNPSLPVSSTRELISLAINGVLARAKTPEAIIRQLNREIVAVLNKADVKEKLFTMGAEIMGNSPEEFAAAIKADMVRFGKVIKEAGIHGE